MKLNIKRLLILFLVLALPFVLLGCTEETNSNNQTDPVSNPETVVTNPTVPSEVTQPEETYVYEGTATVAPFKTYNADGTLHSEYNNMYAAIRCAGTNSTSGNKMYVEDGNGLKIFQRQNQNNYWCYDGTNFVGSKARTEALSWGQNREKCYIIDGRGTGYVMCGTKYYEGSDLNQEINLELISGGYNYMFTDSGYIENDIWIKKGWGYMECYVRLSEANYHPSTDGDGWNAYIFINGKGGISSDLGLIGGVQKVNGENKVVWAICRNCSHQDHKTDVSTYGESFSLPYGWQTVTTMSYDKENKCYNGADDLYFQVWQGVDGWVLRITNLTTNQVFTHNEIHEGMFENSTQYFRFLLAASYCPVVGNIWNARSGAYLRNVVFDGVKIARWNEAETYTEDMYEDFYPDSNMMYGYSQAADCSSMIYSTHNADGTYKSGHAYKAGEKYLSFSCYYDGGGH